MSCGHRIPKGFRFSRFHLCITVCKRNPCIISGMGAESTGRETRPLQIVRYCTTNGICLVVHNAFTHRSISIHDAQRHTLTCEANFTSPSGRTSFTKKKPHDFSCGFFFVLALPIFPASHPASIVGEGVLNFCVRDGNRWTHTPINTNFISFELSVVP